MSYRPRGPYKYTKNELATYVFDRVNDKTGGVDHAEIVRVYGDVKLANKIKALLCPDEPDFEPYVVG